MSGMLEIARSGLSAFRTALAVTSENIANVDTEGYSRRTVSTVTALGGQATATTFATGGQGVTIADVRRAFDSLVAERLRNTTSNRAAAEAHLETASAVEELMIPGDDGIDGILRGFFGAFSTLGGAPADSATRRLALQSAGALATAITGLAGGLDGLAADVRADAAAVVRQSSTLLEELANVSVQMAGLSSSTSSAAGLPLADRRDALLGQLSELLPISVSLANDGRPEVRLGSAAGPVILGETGPARLTLAEGEGVTLQWSRSDGASGETRNLTTGALAGLSRGLGAVGMALDELDSYARDLVDAVNTAHMSGVDQDGEPGQAVFGLSGWKATPGTANGGIVRVDLTTTLQGASGGFDLVYDAEASLWRAFDPEGTEVANGRDRLVLPGVTVNLSGAARDGDLVQLKSVTGHARDLAVLIINPSDLAAAAAFETVSDPDNTGTGRLIATIAEVPASGLLGLGSTLQSGAVDLIPGIVGSLPAGTGSAELVSLGRTAKVSFPTIGAASVLTVSVDGISHEFDVANLGTASMLAAALSGGLQSRDGMTLSQLGLVPQTTGTGGLDLWSPGSSIAPQAQFATFSGTVEGVRTDAVGAGGTVQVFTRSGRQIAGTPLSPEEARTLITEANGFLPGAVYDATALSDSGAGYRGAGVTQSTTRGLPELILGGKAGLGEGPRALAHTLSFTAANGATETVNVPEGASAALTAQLLSGVLPGTEASAVTTVDLSGLANGPVRLALAGTNVSPRVVFATVVDGRLDGLANAINDATTLTGISAELAPDGRRLLLVQEDGHDITIKFEEGSGLRMTPVGPFAQVSGPALDVPVGGTVRQGGHIVLTAPDDFTVVGPDGSQASRNGLSELVGLSTTRAGTEVRLTPAAVPQQVEGGLTYVVTADGYSAQATVASGLSSREVARAMAASLRANAPDASLVGGTLVTLPPNGSTLDVRIEGASYRITMQNGGIVVSGPETGRVSASFDEGNRLVISADGVTGGRGIEVAASATFGFSEGTSSSFLTVAGKPIDLANLPLSLHVELEGVEGTLSIDNAGVTVPPGLDLSATLDASNRLVLTIPAPATGLQIANSNLAGFGGPPAELRLENEALVLSGASDRLAVGVEVKGTISQNLELTGLPPEELLVGMTGSGTLRLAGTVAKATPMETKGVAVTVLDATTGSVALTDLSTGDAISKGTLGSDGRLSLGGFSLQFSGSLASGDVFRLSPTGMNSSDATVARALAALAESDPVTGQAGLMNGFTSLQSDAGVRAAAATRALQTTTASASAAETAAAAISGVDLDTEAGRLVELQQAYQASAQAMVIARELFQTLLDSL